jgi:hypothetical protein
MSTLPLDPSRRNPHDPGPDEAGERAMAVERAAGIPLTTRAGSTIRLGTASWADPTMTAPGVFYPRGTDTAEERLAYYAGTFSVNFQAPDGSPVRHDRGKVLWIVRKFAGQWKFECQIMSSDLPPVVPAAASPAAPPKK